MKILTIDDSATLRKVIIHSLATLGEHRVLEAGDGEEGLNILKSQPDIGLVFLDWNMPKMNGLDFIHHVRATRRFDHVKIIMVTTENSKESIVKVLKAGANSHISKPFTKERFAEIVKPFISTLKPSVAQTEVTEIVQKVGIEKVEIQEPYLLLSSRNHVIRIDMPKAIEEKLLSVLPKPKTPPVAGA